MYEAPIVKQPSRNAWTVALAGLGAFMSALDIVVVSTALPTLQHHRLGASLATLEWTLNAYSLAFGALMPTGAALGDRFGRRRMYVLGLMTFVAGRLSVGRIVQNSRNLATATRYACMWAIAGNFGTDGMSCGYDSSESTPPRVTRRHCGIPTQASM